MFKNNSQQEKPLKPLQALVAPDMAFNEHDIICQFGQQGYLLAGREEKEGNHVLLTFIGTGEVDNAETGI